MNGKLEGFASRSLTVVLIELLVPGGTLVVLALLLSGSSVLAIPEKVTLMLPFLKGWGRA